MGVKRWIRFISWAIAGILVARIVVLPSVAEEEISPRQVIEVAVVEQLERSAGNPPVAPQVTKVQIVENYALATWAWGELAGQALLREVQGEWQVISSGGGVMDATTLMEFGVPSDIASRLLTD